MYSKNDDGSFTETNGRLGAYYSWYTDQYAYDGFANEGYYRVATNEWVKSTDETYIFQSKNYHLTAQVDNYDNVDAKVVTVKYLDAPVYNDYGEKTAEVVPAYSSWKVDSIILFQVLDCWISIIIKELHQTSGFAWMTRK